MRKTPIFAVGLFSALAATSALVACEDGPNQTFSAAPANAGNLWNNGSPDASVATGTASYDASFGSVSALQNCTADQKRVIWANMLEQPIILPLQMAGINMAGKTRAEQESFKGITLQEAESINCVGNPQGPGAITWGDHGEVYFAYTLSNYIANFMVLSLGYQGKMSFEQRPGSRFGQHQYVLQLGQPILRDGVVYEIDWADLSHHDLNEIFNAIMATFGKDLVSADDPNDCYGDGSCLLVTPAQAPSNNGSCFMAFLPIEGFLFATDCTTNTQPTISVPVQMQQQYYLSEPYSYMSSVATINAQGPVSLPRFNNPQDPPNCFLQMGMDWKTYVANCVDFVAPPESISTVIDDAGLTIKQVNEAKMYAAHTHDFETIQFNVVGENLNWVDESIESNPTAIVQDPDEPNVTDAVQARIGSWGIDIYDKGLPINDLDGSGNYTGRGSAYIYREYAELVQADLNRILAAANPTKSGIYNHVIGDPACFVDPATANSLGCTGMEGFVLQTGGTLGDPADNCAGGANAAPICSSYQAGTYFTRNFGGPGYGVTVLRPGNLYGIFCQNPLGVNGGAIGDGGTDPTNGNCNYNTLWVNTLANVVAVAGLGNVDSLPAEITDRRYYFRWYGIADIKYLKAYGQNPNALATDVKSQPIDLESIFYDANEAFDFVEYIERSFMTTSPATYVGNSAGSPGTAGAVTVPGSINAVAMDFDLGANILAGEQQFTTWNKFMYRPEAAMFKAMLVNKSDLPGSENNVNITNLAGNVLLQRNYAAYECATQWPNVTINVPNGAPITGTWADVCFQACPNLQGVYPGCPVPPLAPPGPSAVTCPDGTNARCPAGTGCNPYNNICQSLALDLNGSNPTLGLGGTTPRLAGYPSVWGRGAACANSRAPGGAVPTDASGLYPWDPTNNPYSTSPCEGLANGIPVATGVGSVFSVGQKTKAATRLSFASTDENQLTAYVNVPSMVDPYNAIVLPGGAAPTNIQVTASWRPSYDGVGFNIPIDATRDKFIQTQQVDFGGVLATYLVDVVPWVDPVTHQSDSSVTLPNGSLTVEAIEGDDYLGEAFLCQDVGSFPNPGTGDLLGAHMYDTAASILAWISNHPGSEVNCQIIVRYSIYDNYIDDITSLSTGVDLDISTATGGPGRVVAVVAFDPTLSSAP